MGYSNQTEIITNTTNFEESQTTAPWSCSTGDSCNPIESQGGGDTGYETDLANVRKSYGDIDGAVNSYSKGYRCSGENCATKIVTDYWIASRYYFYNGVPRFFFRVRRINGDGALVHVEIRRYYSGWGYYSSAYAVRPIVTLKTGVKVLSDGNDGSSESKAYNLTN